MAINGIEYSWNNVVVTTMGRTLERITDINYDVEVDLKQIYGRGGKVRGIQDGNEKPSGDMTVGQSELEAMVRAAQTVNPKAKLTDLKFDIQIHYFNGVERVKDRIIGARFTKQPKGMKQGDAAMDVKLPFLCEDIEYNIQ